MSGELKGLRELDRFLSQMPMNLQRNAYGNGLRAAAQVLRDEARLRAPKASGKMARSIKYGSVHRMMSGGWSISVRLDPRGNDHAFLGMFHEYGVAPHYIRAGDAGLSPRLVTRSIRNGGVSEVANQALKINGNFVTGAVLHPGHAAQPFMRPALDLKADDALRAFAARIREYIEGRTGYAQPLQEAA